MNKKECVIIAVLAVFGYLGARDVLLFLSRFISRLTYIQQFLSICAGFLPIWLFEDMQKQYRIRDDERAAILNHERKKQSIILKNHPLLESQEDPHGIRSMDDLDRYFDQHQDDVAGMDYDETGHYIFADHKYIRW